MSHASRVILTTIIAQLACSLTLYGEEVNDSVPLHSLGEVIVTGNSVNRRIADSHLGAENIELSKMSLTPVLFGENDIIKSITLLPGVNSEGEGAGGYEVRGGTASQNHILMDGISLFNPAHVMGIFSTFNEDALARATLYKGPIPAAYGGASSSVLDVGLDSGDPYSYHGALTVGVLAAKIKASGPILGDKLTFAVSARRSYVDMFLKMVPEYRDIVMNFYDVTAKVRYNPSPGNYIDASFFGARDNMSIEDVMGMRWGNVGGSLSWITQAGDRWHFVTTAAVTSYTAKMDMRIMKSSQTLDEFIRSFSINERVKFRINDDHELDGGVRSELLHVKSGEMSMNNNIDKEIKAGWQNAFWIDCNGRFDRLTVTGGLRMSAISAMTCEFLNDFKSSFGS
ncbi:MAG: TonB-dependent receptor plug domain-containing protein, partial [Muribaculaceae bacterium]|nr:TonB-dependent receptor plug domain-containing protein [Muribaculaceae bacterium]